MAEFRVIFTDSGQGDCTLVLFPDGTTMMVDCGATKNKKDVLPELKKLFNLYVKKPLDILVITHPDEDHYNILMPLLVDELNGNLNPKKVVFGGKIDDYKNGKENNRTYNWLLGLGQQGVASDYPDQYAKLNSPWLQHGGVDVYILAANSGGNSNDNSIVLLLIHQKTDYKIFLMGDATVNTEKFIITACKSSNATSLLMPKWHTALKVGHHGSATSSSQTWIELLKPSALIVSSDTKGFGRTGTGIPPRTHLNNIISWTKIANLTSNLKHSYVVYEDDKNAPKYGNYVVENPTTRAICTNLYELIPTINNGFDAVGGSWHWVLTNNTLTVEWSAQ